MLGEELGSAYWLNVGNRHTGNFGYRLRKLISRGSARIDQVKNASATSLSKFDDGRAEVASKGRRAHFVSYDAGTALISQNGQNRPDEMFPAATV